VTLRLKNYCNCVNTVLSHAGPSAVKRHAGKTMQVVESTREIVAPVGSLCGCLPDNVPASTAAREQDIPHCDIARRTRPMALAGCLCCATTWYIAKSFPSAPACKKKGPAFYRRTFTNVAELEELLRLSRRSCRTGPTRPSGRRSACRTRSSSSAGSRDRIRSVWRWTCRPANR